MSPAITLLTDFGTQDGYVGAMKGVILSDHPRATVVDLTHEVPPQDVLAGAFALSQAAPFFPPGTIHVAVVDPGVGSERRAVIVEHAGQWFVGPDNGLLSLATAGGPTGADRTEVMARLLDRLPADWHIHPTFHGRDLFARVAARLAAGASPSELSGSEAPLRRIPLPRPEEVNGDRLGEVIHVDRFGNLITNLIPRTDDQRATLLVEVAGTSQVPFAATYADVERGRLVAYRGSAGYLEVAVREGSAATLLGAGRGARVRVRRRA